uniref:Putative secreted protein n=1 Tax=Ixodes ricinus TaxID=34613 RepID=A0A6B0UHF1_IXORI
MAYVVLGALLDGALHFAFGKLYPYSNGYNLWRNLPMEAVSNRVCRLLVALIRRWRHKIHSSLIRLSANASAGDFGRVLCIIFLQEHNYAFKR